MSNEKLRVTFDEGDQKSFVIDGVLHMLTRAEVKRAVPQGDCLYDSLRNRPLGYVSNFGLDDDDHLWVDIGGPAWIMP